MPTVKVMVTICGDYYRLNDRERIRNHIVNNFKIVYTCTCILLQLTTKMNFKLIRLDRDLLFQQTDFFNLSL